MLSCCNSLRSLTNSTDVVADRLPYRHLSADINFDSFFISTVGRPPGVVLSAITMTTTTVAATASIATEIASHHGNELVIPSSVGKPLSRPRWPLLPPLWWTLSAFWWFWGTRLFTAGVDVTASLRWRSWGRSRTSNLICSTSLVLYTTVLLDRWRCAHCQLQVICRQLDCFETTTWTAWQ